MFKIIKGTFHVKGFQPDGDSIRFKADEASNWNALHFIQKPKRKNPLVQLRFEGIDALEIHYNGYHQPRSFAIGALEKLFEYLGITDVAYSLSVRTIIEAKDGTEGYIAVAEVDAFNRPVCLAFPPTIPFIDGAEIEAAELPIKWSINYKLCQEGLVYPTFYASTNRTLASLFAEATKEAREARRGFWVIDRTNGFKFYDVRTIYEDILILPKLFRRLTSFCERYGDIGQLIAYLKSDKDFIELSDGSQTSLDEIIGVRGRFVQLLKQPEELFFLPKS